MAPTSHDAAPEQKFLRKVLHVDSDGILVHFRLACGHLITERKSDVRNPLPAYVDCWACRAAQNQ
ncbi:MAG TPA: hypothetical protein VMU45_01480 [Candidatus Eisenbacteria bacterium]|nr:hypothetical protein [Candidatus Eisenbacteria bacterium]